MPQQSLARLARAAAYKAVEAASELRAEVAHAAVVVMIGSEELPAMAMGTDEFEAILARNLVGVPIVIEGGAVAEIIPNPDKLGELYRLVGESSWVAMSEAIHIAWERHCPKGLVFPSDTPTPPRGFSDEQLRNDGWDV